MDPAPDHLTTTDYRIDSPVLHSLIQLLDRALVLLGRLARAERAQVDLLQTAPEFLVGDTVSRTRSASFQRRYFEDVIIVLCRIEAIRASGPALPLPALTYLNNIIVRH